MHRGTAQQWEKKLLLRIITLPILQCSWLELMCCLNQNVAASRDECGFFLFFLMLKIRTLLRGAVRATVRVLHAHMREFVDALGQSTPSQSEA